MKRLIVITALLIVSFASEAQVVIRSNKDKNVKTVSSTVIKKEVIYKERKLYDAKRGFQQFVELSPKLDLYELEKGHTGINYIGGWRFNNWLFVGAGTGLEFAHHVASGMKQYVGESYTWYSDDSWGYSSSSDFYANLNAERYGSLNLVSVPLYAHIRTYYMRTSWAPYSSVSLGGRLAPKESGIYFDFSTGVDYRMNEKLHAYFSIGFWVSTFIKAYYYSNYHADEMIFYPENENCRSQACPYHSEDHYHFTKYDVFSTRGLCHGLSFRLGVSF